MDVRHPPILSVRPVKNKYYKKKNWKLSIRIGALIFQTSKKQYTWSNLPYPCDKVEQLVTLKNSSTCPDKGAAPDNMMRIRPPNPCLIYND
jgi:hypothetical protein